MKFLYSYFRLVYKLLLGSLLLFSLSHCASYTPEADQDGATPAAQPAPVIQHEGGIVGTGNDYQCRDKNEAIRCNENVK